MTTPIPAPLSSQPPGNPATEGFSPAPPQAPANLVQAASVPMIFDDGSRSMVPQENMQAAVQAGGKIVSPVKFDDGSRAWVTADRLHDAVAAGGRMMSMDEAMPKPGLAQRVGESLKGMFSSIPTVTSPYPGMDLERKQEVAQQSAAEDQVRQQEGHGTAYRLAAPAAEAVGAPVSTMEEGAREGDPNKVLGAAVAGAGVAAAPLAAEGALHAPGIVRDVANHLVPAAPVVADALDTTRSVRAALPQETAGLPKPAIQGAEDVFRASAPVGANTRFRANVYAAAGDLAEVGQDVRTKLADAKGGVIQPDMRARVTVDAINQHLKEMYDTERAPQIANHADAPVPLEINDDAAAGLTQMSRAGEASVAKLAAKARGGTLTLAEADELARGVNAELRKYEAMTPEAQAAARVNTKALNGLKVLDRSLAEGIDDQLRIDGQPGIREYERRYAALSQIRDQIRVRMNAAELDHPGLAKAAGRAATSLLTKRPLAGASQASVADVRMGRALQQGLEKLADSGIKANRALPRSPAPLELTPPPGRVPPAGQEHLPFNEGRTEDMQTGPNGPLNLTGEGRVPPATQEQLNFNGADQEPEQKPPVPERRGGNGSGGPRATVLSEAERQQIRAKLDELHRGLHPNPHLAENPFDRHPSHNETIRAADVLSGR